MKRNTSILIKTTALVLAFMLLLGVGIMSLSFSHSGVKPNDDNFLTPDLGITAPTSQELLQRKFNAYNTVTEENGKSVVTIFSEEQIADFNDRRNNGEWFWLSSEEMLFLINNTVELFKTYDIVYIRDLDGNLNKYYGLSFFSSEEYYASFNGFDLGVTDASFDLKKDIYDTIFKRVEVFSSFVDINKSWTYSITDVEKKPTEEELLILQSHSNPWFWNGKTDRITSKEFYAWTFYKEEIFFTKVDPYIESFYSPDNSVEVYPLSALPDRFDVKKYEAVEKTLIIELYKENSQELIARLRYNENDHPEIISQVQDKLLYMTQHDSGSGDYSQITSYRAVLYFNGFNAPGYSSNPSIRYCPDGDIDYFAFTDGNDIFQNEYIPKKGSRVLTEYINELLAQFFNNPNNNISTYP